MREVHYVHAQPLDRPVRFGRAARPKKPPPSGDRGRHDFLDQRANQPNRSAPAIDNRVSARSSRQVLADPFIVAGESEEYVFLTPVEIR